jgi:hypothetical protein
MAIVTVLVRKAIDWDGAHMTSEKGHWIVSVVVQRAAISRDPHHLPRWMREPDNTLGWWR